MTTQMSLVVAPTTFTLPASSTRYYFTPAVTRVGSQVEIMVAYSDPDTGNTNLQAQTYLAYTADTAGDINTSAGFTDWITPFNPQTVPKYTLDYNVVDFSGPAASTDFGEYFDTVSGSTATFYPAVATSGGTVTQVGTGITVTPVAKTLTDNITANFGNPGGITSLSEQIFEVAGAPGPGQTNGTFIIFDSTATVLFGPSTGFSYADGKAHAFQVGGWNPTYFAELVEVWNPITNLADVQLNVIGATTSGGEVLGSVKPGWTAATELNSITFIGFQFVNGAGAGMILLADGSDAGGRGFFEYVVNDTTSSGGSGGVISKEVAVHYGGAVTQDARLRGAGITNEYILYWVDANGLTINLIDNNLNILQTYNIAEANGTANIISQGNGEIFVTYRVQTGSGSSPSAVDKYAILSFNAPVSTSLVVSSGQTSAGLNVVSGGSITVLSGGTAFDTFISSGGIETVSNGGTLSGAFASSGGTLVLLGSNTSASQFRPQPGAIVEVGSGFVVNGAAPAGV
jgi:autotransporter passenger strand-loop-strand repeat protein